MVKYPESKVFTKASFKKAPANPMATPNPLASAKANRRLFAIFSILVLLIATQLAYCVPLEEKQLQRKGSYNNLVDEFITNLMDDRLKKSRSSKQYKQTLRFGRRSDPWMMGPSLQEQLALDELEKRQQLGD